MAAKAHRVFKAAELRPGECRIVEVGGRSIGVYNVKGEFHAIRNQCPHQLAPLCQGKLGGTALPGKVGEYKYGLDGQVVRCPWHGWEFDVTSGRSLFNPHRCRVRAYEVFCETDSGERVARTVSSDEPDPAVETFPVEVEGAWIVVRV